MILNERGTLLTVSEFAISMYRCGLVKDTAIVICNDEVLYNDRLEFLRYANDEGMPDRLWYADEIVEEVTVKAVSYIPGEVPDYIITFKIRK